MIGVPDPQTQAVAFTASLALMASLGAAGAFLAEHIARKQLRKRPYDWERDGL